MSDVFQVGNGVPANYDDGTVELVVNGTKKGRVRINPGENIGAFLTRQAQAYGVRTFSAFGDGRKLDTVEAKNALTGIKQIELVAKDARGTKLRHLWHA